MTVINKDRLNRFVSLSACSILILFFGCAGVMQSTKPMSPASSAGLMRDVAFHAQRLKTFQGWGRMTVSTPDGSYSLVSIIRAKSPDSLYLKIRGPLGISVGTLVAGGGQFVFYQPMVQALYEGRIEDVPLAIFLQTDLDPRLLMPALMGLMVPQLSEQDSATAVPFDKHKYRMNTADGDLIEIDRKGPVVTRWEKNDIGQGGAWQWEAENFTTKNSVRVPRVIRVNGPETRLMIYYEKFSINEPLKSNWNDLTIPEGVHAIAF